MADIIRVLNWNVAGAKYLETKDRQKREELRERVNDDLLRYTRNNNNRAPHVICLQEIVQVEEPKEKLVDFIAKEKFPEYDYIPFPLVDTNRHAYTSKWKKIEPFWKKKTYFAQGNAIMFRKDNPPLPVWSLARSTRDESKNANSAKQNSMKNHHLIENVIIRSGIYFGNRDTEPRSALVSHFVFDRDDDPKFLDEKTRLPKPQDVFVVNLHLTTLMGEREGLPKIDDKAVKTRLQQLDTIFNEIISTYNEWARSGFLTRTKKPRLSKGQTTSRFNPLWILCGDFNFTPESAEYDYIKRRNFVNTIPENEKTKAKGVDNDASLTLDYIFAGPKFISLDEHIGNRCFGSTNQEIRSSDHRPMFSCIPLGYI